MPTCREQLAHLTDDHFRHAWNMQVPTEKFDGIASPAVHYDAKCFMLGLVTAKIESTLTKISSSQKKFGASASAGALWIEIGSVVVGYTNRCVLLFMGSYLHGPLSQGLVKPCDAHGNDIPRPSGVSKLEDVLSRTAFVHFLNEDWKIKNAGECVAEAGGFYVGFDVVSPANFFVSCALFLSLLKSWYQRNNSGT